MKILFLGDVVGKVGRQALQIALPDLRSQYQPDVIIVNGENATHGKGIGWNAYNFIRDLGVDCITGGDHSFDVLESKEILADSESILLRPANYPENQDTPGVGYSIIETKAGKLGVINLQGRVFMREGMDSPFQVVDKILALKEFQDLPIFVDFHTEATSEIMAMGWFLDGRVSAVVGTHTHVQTNDARMLPKGTVFISDVGMVGPLHSVLGVQKEIILKKFLTGLPVKHELAEMPAVVSGVVVDTEAQSIEPILQILED